MIETPLSPMHQAARRELIAWMRKHGEHLPPIHLLALAAGMVGQIMAMQDQSVSAEMALTLILKNIEHGNQAVIALLDTPEGRA